MTTLLKEFRIPRAPLRYGNDTCCLELADSTYSQEIIDLRNDPSVGKFLNDVNVSLEEHERWSASRLTNENVLDFVILIEGKFAGNISLSNIAFAQRCEWEDSSCPPTAVASSQWPRNSSRCLSPSRF